MARPRPLSDGIRCQLGDDELDVGGDVGRHTSSIKQLPRLPPGSRRGFVCRLELEIEHVVDSPIVNHGPTRSGRSIDRLIAALEVVDEWTHVGHTHRWVWSNAASSVLALHPGSDFARSKDSGIRGFTACPWG